MQKILSESDDADRAIEILPLPFLPLDFRVSGNYNQLAPWPFHNQVRSQHAPNRKATLRYPKC